MGIKLDQIKDPNVRKRIIDASISSKGLTHRCLDAGGADSESPTDSAGYCPNEIRQPHPRSTITEPQIETKKRIRQRSGDTLNKLERDWLEVLAGKVDSFHRSPWPQSVTLRLANGVTYTPDLFSFAWDGPGGQKPTAWEVKGFFRDDAVVKLKVAANRYTGVRFILVWRVKGEWKQQEVLA